MRAISTCWAAQPLSRDAARRALRPKTENRYEAFTKKFPAFVDHTAIGDWVQVPFPSVPIGSKFPDFFVADVNPVLGCTR